MVALDSLGATTLIIKKKLRMSLDEGGEQKSRHKKGRKEKNKKHKDALENTL
jgi:hypothetical protein